VDLFRNTAFAKQAFLGVVVRVLDKIGNYLPLSERRMHFLNHPPFGHASKPDSAHTSHPASAKDSQTV
jgi:hypothetical protein